MMHLKINSVKNLKYKNLEPEVFAVYVGRSSFNDYPPCNCCVVIIIIFIIIIIILAFTLL